MGLEVVDNIILKKRSDLAEIPKHSLTHFEEENNLKKDNSGKSLLVGTVKRRYMLDACAGLKKSTARLEFRPLYEVSERVDLSVIIRVIRDGKEVDRKYFKKTLQKTFLPAKNERIDIELSNKRLVAKTALNDGDIVEISVTNKTEHTGKIFFANIYIIKEY